jgi:hypothetical protein
MSLLEEDLAREHVRQRLREADQHRLVAPLRRLRHAEKLLRRAERAQHRADKALARAVTQ